ncbi:MAG: alpha-amylase family glycosyl hydrolase [Clostridia bacterium]|nr:alpha-amylase family glycosyl hydrolase [Clostridia bacterium]
MAQNTSKALRNQVMYSIFVRNYSPEGTFEGVRRDLDRIQRLGVDVIWLMPIHPVGKVARKGALGSPYANYDYRAINPEFGTLADFRALVDDIHARGMKCIIDVVYNHTSPDSVLSVAHPEWFYHKPDGSFGNRVGDWTDIIDLDYGQPELWDYQIETLKQWAQIVDGFRCDVAPLLPLDFWLRARREVAEVRPDCLWLSESVEPSFVAFNRDRGMNCLSDSEVYQAFDICYEYDVYGWFKGYLEGTNTLAQYAERVTQQETIYPDNYVKLRYLENHDNTRAHFLIPDARCLRNWTAFMYFQKGMTLLYAGQEVGCSHLPSLFDRDTVDWTPEIDLQEMFARLYRLKKHPLLADSTYDVRALPRDILLANHRRDGRALTGVFSVRGESSLVGVDAPEGRYVNLLDGEPIEVHRGKIACNGEPIVFEWRAE